MQPCLVEDTTLVNYEQSVGKYLRCKTYLAQTHLDICLQRFNLIAEYFRDSTHRRFVNLRTKSGISFDSVWEKVRKRCQDKGCPLRVR